MSKSLKVYFVGDIGSGKTTAAEYLTRNYRTFPLSEGKRLRDVARKLFQNDERKVLQSVGEGMREALGWPTFWLDLVLKQVQETETAERSPITSFTIDDVRHPCDAHKLNSLGWVGVKVLCRDAIRMERVKARGRDTNLTLLDRLSGHLLDDIKFPYEVDNSWERLGTMMQLDAIVQDITGEAYLPRPEVSE